MNDIKIIENILPDTYYSDRPIEFRVKKLVEDWQRAIKVNEELEEEIMRYMCGFDGK